jgi:hypothetical protein
MKLCPQCNASLLPYAMITLIAGVIGFLTWLTLGLSDWDEGPRALAAAGACLAVGVTLWHYVVSCMRRHCRHHDHNHRSLTLPPTRP